VRTARLLRTATFRMALIYLAPFGALVIILFGVLYWGTLHLIDSQTTATIEAEIRGLAEQYNGRDLNRLIEVIAERSKTKGDQGAVYLLTSPDLQPLAGNLEAWPESAETRDGWLDFEQDRGEGEQAATREIRAKPFRLAGGFRLLVGRDTAERAQFQAVVGTTLAWALCITILLGVAGALYLSHSLLRRVEAVAETSGNIVHGRLAERIPLDGSGDEFDRLSESLNEMLEQIEHLMTGMRAVTDSLAHDLRSPLTRLKGRIEVALRAAPDAANYRAALEQTIADADAILVTFNALLAIAQAEAGTLRANMTPLDLSVIARNALELYEPLAEERKLKLDRTLEDGVFIVGHAQLLSQSLANLLDNAVKYSPVGGHVAISVRATADRAEFVVADDGPGIPADEQERVLERFVRLDQSRSTPGSGLGLSLVAAVAKLHRATLRLEDNNPGLKVTLSFERTAIRHGTAAAA
jgi:signal transduction histidine kinase